MLVNPWRYKDILLVNQQEVIVSLPWKFRLQLLERISKYISDLHGKGLLYGKKALDSSHVYIEDGGNFGLESLEIYPRFEDPCEADYDIILFGILALEIILEKPAPKEVVHQALNSKVEPLSVGETKLQTIMNFVTILPIEPLFTKAKVLFSTYISGVVESKIDENPEQLRNSSVNLKQSVDALFEVHEVESKNWLQNLRALVIDCISKSPKMDAKAAREGMLEVLEQFVLGNDDEEKYNLSSFPQSNDFALEATQLDGHVPRIPGTVEIYHSSEIASEAWRSDDDDATSQASRYPIRSNQRSVFSEKISHEVEENSKMISPTMPADEMISKNGSSTVSQNEFIHLENIGNLFDSQRRLERNQLIWLLNEAKRVLTCEPNLLSISAPVSVVGDIHGQYYDLRNLLSLISLRDNTSKILFLGDYVDRGKWSCETLFYLLRLKIEYPSKIYLLRGNHEADATASTYGFRAEIDRKYGREMYHRCLEVFKALPLACLIHIPTTKPFLALHGGISQNVRSLEDISKVDRFAEPPMEGILCDILWSDPVSNDSSTKSRTLGSEFEKIEFLENKVRGCAQTFGYSAIQRFLSSNNLIGLIRAHEAKEEGFQFHFQDVGKKKHLVTTVFSAPNYLKAHGNKGAYLFVHDAPKSDSSAGEKEDLDPVLFLEPVPFQEAPAPQVESAVEDTYDLEREVQRYCPYLSRDVEEFYHNVLDIHDFFGPARFQEESSLFEKHASEKGRLNSPQLDTRSALESFDGDSSQKKNIHSADKGKSIQRMHMMDEIHPTVIKERLSSSSNINVLAIFKSSPNTNELSVGKTKFSPKEKEIIQKVFFTIDRFDTGAVGAEEIQAWAQEEGCEIGYQDAKLCVEAIDYDGDGRIGTADFFIYAAKLKEDWNLQFSKRGTWRSGKSDSESESDPSDEELDVSA